MITQKEFENILQQPETSILDFKSKMYDLSDDLSKFVKDIISFANTIRSETAYIIIGVEENADGSKILNGLDINIDDSILQDKVKDKVQPLPVFSYYTISYQEKTFGVLEFPVVKYSWPISPVIKMKGLEPRRVYYRHGTTNTEAIGYENIRINDWLKSLPEIGDVDLLNKEINRLLRTLTRREELLSAVTSDILIFARKFKLHHLESFVSAELKGLDAKVTNANPETYKYRFRNVIISPLEIKLRPFDNASSIKSEMQKSNDFFDYKLLFLSPITEIEDYLRRFKESSIVVGIVRKSSRSVFVDSLSNEYPVMFYLFEEDYIGLYNGIRQKLIDTLMEIK